jgi:hypothetical protein
MGGEGEPAAKLRGHDWTSVGGLRSKQGRKEERFFPFFGKGTQTKFKHKFEFNQPKINAPANSYISLF